MSPYEHLLPTDRERRLVAEFGEAFFHWHGDNRLCCFSQAYHILLEQKLIREPQAGFSAFLHCEKWDPASSGQWVEDNEGGWKQK